MRALTQITTALKPRSDSWDGARRCHHGLRSQMCRQWWSYVGIPEVKPVSYAHDFWRQHNKTSTHYEDRSAAGVWKQYDVNPETGVEVVKYTLEGARHTWPGSPVPGIDGPAAQSINATEEIWCFFQRHHKSQSKPPQQ